jgi:hypothetical protein
MRTDAQQWTIKAQTIEDLPTGLTLQFEVVPDDLETPFRLRILGDLPFGNREIMFDRDGREAGSGMVLAGLWESTWLSNADEYPATD